MTGNLLWDDDHNGSADVGTTIRSSAPNKYHNPWRATAWEIHPIAKIEVLDSALPMATATPAASIAASPADRFVTLGRPVVCVPRTAVDFVRRR